MGGYLYMKFKGGDRVILIGDKTITGSDILISSVLDPFWNEYKIKGTVIEEYSGLYNYKVTWDNEKHSHRLYFASELRLYNRWQKIII